MADLVEDRFVEKVILVGVHLTGRLAEEDSEESLRELEQLAETAGAVVLHKVLQKKKKFDSAYHIGIGKAEEVLALAEMSGCNLLVFDTELASRKVRNLEKFFNIRVIDRTELILDIFARRARSREGILQVELALYTYKIGRLSGKGIDLSRQGGGIGTKGPGETKLETDKRVLRNKIRKVRLELEKINQNRMLHRSRRQKQAVPIVAIVGYTNAGKSTLFRAMTSEEVLVDDMLFATLDPIVRKVKLSDDKEVLLVDTVGFINNLPHHLVDAFRSTLEELAYASLLLKVIDVSHPFAAEHEKVIDRLVAEVGADDIPVIRVYNKTDKVDSADIDNRLKGDSDIFISALHQNQLDLLKDKIESAIFNHRAVLLEVPPARGDILARLYAVATVREQKVENNMIIVHAEIDLRYEHEFKEFISDNNAKSHPDLLL